jgi:homocitrate synthase NifV
MRPDDAAPPLLSRPPAAVLLDTTLRDGEQAPGVALGADHKAAYVELAEEAGIRYLEVGFPQNRLDLEPCRAAARAARQARVVMMALTTPESLAIACDAGAHEVLFVFPASYSHLAQVYGGSYESLRDRLLECVSAAAALGVAANVGLEDASQGDLPLIFRILDDLAPVAADVDCVTIPDTRGQLLPEEVAELLAHVRRRLPSRSCRLAFHAHNDLGVATANSVAALRAPAAADCLHVTACGFGERAGNASLEQLVAIMECKLGIASGVRPERLPGLCGFVEEAFWTPVCAHAPVVGAKVFTHESGLHQKALLRDGRSYQYLDPGRFGRKGHLIFGKHSGSYLRARIAAEAGCEAEDVLAYQRAMLSRLSPARRLREELDALLAAGYVGAPWEQAAAALRRPHVDGGSHTDTGR